MIPSSAVRPPSREAVVDAERHLAVLDAVGPDRIARYRSAVAEVHDLASAIRTAHTLFLEDRASGHLADLASLLASVPEQPTLAPELTQRLEPWLRFTEDQFERMTRGTPLLTMIPAHDAAFAVLALYLGTQLLSTLESHAGAAETLFDTGDRLATWVALALGGDVSDAAIPGGSVDTTD